MKTIIMNAVLLLTITLFCSIAEAALYVWTDENGMKHFSDTKPNDDSDIAELKVPKTASRSTASEGTVGSRAQKGKNQSASCHESLRRCESQWRDSYRRSSKSCNGDWTAAAAIGNKLYGGSRTGGEMKRNCKKEQRDNRDKALKSCRKTYRMCLAN